MEDDSKKPHRKRQAGKKAEKKKKGKIDPGLTPKQRNPKAFAFNSARSGEKSFRRTADVLEKKHHPLVVDRSSELPPPTVVVVAGPPGVGKTTLIQALVKMYTKNKVTKVQGPITVIAGKDQNKKTRRLTFIEALCDIHSMVDVVKVADLVIMMMSAEKTYEMEMFEFFCLSNNLNETKMLGIITHMDLMKTNKIKKKNSKMLKERFMKEISQRRMKGTKVHMLDGFRKMTYIPNQVRLIVNSINRIKYAPRDWLRTHPYIIADRFEDITDQDEIRKNPAVERTVCFFGYVHGTLFKSQIVHIPGCRDYAVKSIRSVQDPCPPIEQIKKRSLNDRERRLYAPMSGVGGILYDKDAIYIDIGGSHALRDNQEREGMIGELISSLKDAKSTIDEKIALASSGADNEEDSEDDEEDEDDMDVDDDDEYPSDEDEEEEEDGNDEEDSDEEDEESEDGDGDSEADGDELGRANKKRKRTDGQKIGRPSKKPKQDGDVEESDEAESDEDEAESDEDEAGSDEGDDSEEENEATNASGAKWKENLREKGIEAFLSRQKPNIEKLIYDPPENILPDSGDEADGDDDLIGGLFSVGVVNQTRDSRRKNWVDNNDLSIKTSKHLGGRLEDSDVSALISNVRDCFVTGKWAEGEDARALQDEDDDGDVYGDYEDLEAGSNEKDQAENDNSHGDDDDSGAEAYSGSDDDEEEEDGKQEKDSDAEEDDKKPPEDETPEERRERRMKEKLLAKKKRQKALFNSGGLDSTSEEKTYYDIQREQMQQQAETNRNEFKDLDEDRRVEIEGFRPGLYVRVELKIDCEFVKYFDPRYPIILGGILPNEDLLGYVTAKIIVHRFQKLGLRNRDPAIIALGWRRMESVIMFSKRQDNGIYRSQKMAHPCYQYTATFWGPVTPQNTPVVMISTDPVRKFRILTTGVVSKQEKSMDIVKKVPLVGYPLRIFNKTAFIQKMFNSSLEVAKFEMAAIQTVSGIRGTIKKAAGEGPDGTFRATFEDKILMSDIIILRATTSVDKDAIKYYQPVSNNLLPVSERKNWQGMKLRYHLEKEKKTKKVFKADSDYRKITRKERVFHPLVVPKDLQKNLPFKDKPKSDVQRTDKVQSGRIAVIKEPLERKRDDLMKRIMAHSLEKRRQKRVEMRSRAAEHQKKMAVHEKDRQAKEKVRNKKFFAKQGLSDKKKRSKEDND